MQMTQKPWETAHVGVADFMCDELVLHVETRREKVLQRPSTQLLFLLRAEEERKRKQDGKQTFRQKNWSLNTRREIWWSEICWKYFGAQSAAYLQDLLRLMKAADGLFTDECLHTVGGFVAQKAKWKKSATHYTAGDDVMSTWWEIMFCCTMCCDSCVNK